MSAFLRSVWAEPRPTDVPARVWRDWVLVAVLVPAAIAEGVLRPGLPMRALSVAVTLGLVATLLWRRTRPLVMVVIAFAVTGLVQALTAGAVPVQYAGACVLLLPYALYRWGSGREIVIGSAVVFAKIGLSAVPRLGRASDAMAGVAFMSAMMAMGAAYRFRARARVRALDQVRLRERENLARELHDTVAHHVSAIAIRAQAGLATAAMAPEAATEAATEALRVVEAEASRALAEMRDMVRVLRRNEPADLAPSPAITDLATLASQDSAGGDGPDRDEPDCDGPSVSVELSGDLTSISPAVASAIYRLAQESVTNARRHARYATRISVRVAADGESVRLLVTDDGEPAFLRPAGTPGYGLIGMTERARLLGGTCEAGPDPAGGWTVTAVLPRIPRNGTAA